MKVRDILKNKGPEVYTIGDEKQLRDAVEILTRNNIGVLIVISDNAKIEGIISERDILKACYHNPDSFLDIRVKDCMTTKLLIAEPDDDIDYVQKIMTENRIRHLPVLHNKILVGLISIGDVVKAQLSDKMYENKYLMDYISGNVR
ncbi:MAG: CBS domain-containing protein [Candidatus Kapabacteria bacterium]|nr:CBS domain-containing protein [Candidatus Kapabacteria bacterium]